MPRVALKLKHVSCECPPRAQSHYLLVVHGWAHGWAPIIEEDLEEDVEECLVLFDRVGSRWLSSRTDLRYVQLLSGSRPPVSLLPSTESTCSAEQLRRAARAHQYDSCRTRQASAAVQPWSGVRSPVSWLCRTRRESAALCSFGVAQARR